MDGLKAFALSLAWLAGLAPLVAHAAPKTVCTITVNSDDEREVLRRNLPPGEYDFVELVDRGSLDALTRLYTTTRSPDVQSAVAGILIRSDLDAIGRSALLDTLRLHRVKPTGGATLVDVLIRVLENRS